MKSYTSFFNIRLALTAIVFAVCMMGPSYVSAQKFAYIDSDYVLLHMPDYAAAQQELNAYAIEWQEEIEAKLDAAWICS